MIPKRIKHKGVCEHPQTPYARRKCRAATIARITQEAKMIKTVQIENRTRNWRGEEKRVVEEYTQIEGTVTATGDDGISKPGAGRTPVYTIDAGGTTVTVANVHGVATDMRPVQVGDRVRVLASGQCLVADYIACTIERI